MTIPMNPDFRDLLAAFCDHRVEHIVVGAHALAVHGHIRATKDLDVWVKPSRENGLRVMQALADFGADTGDLTVDDLSHPRVVYQIGVPPVRIDILTAVDGVDFDSAWNNRTEANVDGLCVPVLSRNDLILNKRTTGRLQDLADVERLEELSPECE